MTFRIVSPRKNTAITEFREQSMIVSMLSELI
jgi:hypothetical protein